MRPNAALPETLADDHPPCQKPVMNYKAKLFLIISTALGCSTLHAADYHLIGGYSGEKINKWPICRHRMIKHYPLESRKDRAQAAKAHYEAYKGQEPWDKLLTPDEAAIVYEYQKEMVGYGCTVTTYTILTGSDLEAVRARMQKSVGRPYSEFKTAPKAVFEWPGSDYKREVVREYEGLEVRYRAVESNTRTVVALKIRNTRRDKAAVVRLRSGNQGTGQIFTVEPGATLSHAIHGPDEQFTFAYGFVEPAVDRQSALENLVDYIKQEVRESVSVKKHGVKVSPEKNPNTWGTGVRG